MELVLKIDDFKLCLNERGDLILIRKIDDIDCCIGLSHDVKVFIRLLAAKVING